MTAVIHTNSWISRALDYVDIPHALICFSIVSIRWQQATKPRGGFIWHVSPTYHMYTAALGHCLGCYSMSIILNHRRPTTHCPKFWCLSRSFDLERWLYVHAERHRMNNQQVKAFMQAFTNRITLIQGPPGTGKTETAAWIVDAFAKLDKNILLTSGPNAAIDNVGKN